MFFGLMALTLYRGVTYPSSYQHTDGNGNRLPLTGCTVFFTIKPVNYDEDATDTSAVFKQTITSHTDAANGYTEWDTLVPATGVTPGKNFYCDIVVQNSDGEDLPPVFLSKVTISGKVTNRTS